MSEINRDVTERIEKAQRALERLKYLLETFPDDLEKYVTESIVAEHSGLAGRISDRACEMNYQLQAALKAMP